MLLDDQDSWPSQLETLFTGANKRAAEEFNLYKTKSYKPPKKLRKKVKRMIDKRRKLFVRLKEERNVNNFLEYKRVDSETKALLRAEKRRLYDLFLNQANRCIENNDIKGLWEWVRKASGYKNKNVNFSGVRKDATSEPTADPVEIAEIWVSFFGRLAEDKPGNSRSREVWEERGALLEEHPNDETNDLSWFEVVDAVRLMPNGKAAGIDDFPAEWIKMILVDENCEICPQSPFAQALWKLLKAVWDSEIYPFGWDTAVVVPVPKKSDLTICDNYSGISLISVTAKILSSVIATRIQKWAEDNGKLDRAQAGFRKREETTAQIAALYEICMRRKIKQERTLLTIIDYAKAYDSVPHQALILKLSKMGLPRKLLSLVEAVTGHQSW